MVGDTAISSATVGERNDPALGNEDALFPPDHRLQLGALDVAVVIGAELMPDDVLGPELA